MRVFVFDIKDDILNSLVEPRSSINWKLQGEYGCMICSILNHLLERIVGQKPESESIRPSVVLTTWAQFCPFFVFLFSLHKEGPVESLHVHIHIQIQIHFSLPIAWKHSLQFQCAYICSSISWFEFEKGRISPRRK